MKKIRNIIIYIICGALVACFGVVLIHAKTPKVSDEYRLYYLTHDLKVWPGDGNFTYKLGTKEYMTKQKLYNYTRCLRLGSGWMNDGYVDPTGLINSEDESFLYYKFSENVTNGRLVIDIAGFANSQSVKSLPDNPTSADVSKTLSTSESGSTTEKAEIYISEMGGEDTYIGEYSGVGTFEYNLPKLEKDKVYVVTFKADKYTYKLRSIMVK